MGWAQIGTKGRLIYRLISAMVVTSGGMACGGRSRLNAETSTTDACAAVPCSGPRSACPGPTTAWKDGPCPHTYDDGTPCDEGTLCTIGDACLPGVCAGAPRACDTPPDPTCVSATTRRTWTPSSTSAAGACAYEAVDIHCPWGCDAGACRVTDVASVAISAGYGHTCALIASGALKCWGDNESDQLGAGSTLSSVPAPIDVAGLSAGVLAVAAGANHTCAITAGRALKCWGANNRGQLGDNSTANSPVPVDVLGLSSGVLAVTAGAHHTCAVTAAHAVKCWGANDRGQLGDNSTVESPTPVEVMGLSTGVVAVTTGAHHTCAVTADGAVRCWGANDRGQLGDNSTANSPVPVDVLGLSSGVLAVAAGANHTCAITGDRAVKCWGANSYGELGNNSTVDRPVPGNVVGLSSGVRAMSLGGGHSCAIILNGGVKCWGFAADGQLGNGPTNSYYSTVPVETVGLPTGAMAVSAGGLHTCCLSSATAVKCWGANLWGELGNNSTIDSPVPVDVVAF